MSHSRPRDVALALGSLRRDDEAGAAFLSCGRLLQTGCISNLSYDELRRPRTILRVSTACDDDSRNDVKEEPEFEVALKSVGARLIEVRSNLGTQPISLEDNALLELVRKTCHVIGHGVEFPVLICCQSREAVAIAVVVVLLAVVGADQETAMALADVLAPNPIVRESWKISDSILESVGNGIDLEHIRTTLQGPPAGRGDVEATWLKQDLSLMKKLVRSADDEVGRFWYGEIAQAGQRLSTLSRVSDAVAAFFVRGWALARLERVTEAHQALTLGKMLAADGRAKRELVNQITHELEQLPKSAGLEGNLVVELDEASEADYKRHVSVLTFEKEAESDSGSGQLSWKLLPLPSTFSWIIYNPPQVLFACGMTADQAQTPSLSALGLTRCIQADGPDGSEEPPIPSTVESIAAALKEGQGCFVHSAPTSAASGIAVACFICKYGFQYPDDWTPEQPAHSAAESAELVRGMRGETSLGGPTGDAAVQFFERSLWAEIMLGSVRKRVAPQGPEELKRRTAAIVAHQPGDGNCLFHSLAFGLGGEKAGSLRKKVCDFMREHKDLDISGTSLEEWVQMSSQCSVAEYAKRMQRAGEWGGAPEIAVCARMKGVDVNVYEHCSGGGFELVAPFCGSADGTASGKVVSVVYVGRMHYDALII